jgi:opacity protein-like surface antigen
MRIVARALLALTSLAAPAAAADLAVELHGGYLDLSGAHQAAKAVFDGRAGGFIGGAALRLDFGERYFVRLGAGYFERRGQRVFVADDQAPVFRLGHPLEVRLVPTYLDVALRVGSERQLRPYLGLGIGGVLFREESEVAGEIFTEERTRASARALLGASWGRGPVQLGAELSYSRTPDTIGIGGVSKVYREKDVGGIAAVATLAWRP